MTEKEANKIVNKCLKPIIYSVYGNAICGDTLQDLLSNMVAYINKCIDDVSSNTDLVNKIYEFIKNQGLRDEVTKYINQLIDNGTFEQIINQELFGDLSDNVIDLKNKDVEIEQDILTNTNDIATLKNNVVSNSNEITSIKNDNTVRDDKINKIENKTKNFVTLEELGAIGDGVSDDLHALNKAMELMLQNKIKKVIGNNVYAISDTFYIDNKNDITFEIDTIKPTNSFAKGKKLISIGSKSAGSMANIVVKINLLDGLNKSNGIDIDSCGSSLFDVKTCVNLLTAFSIDNPTRICSDNKFTGNNIRQCEYGIVLRSEGESACEGTIIDYNFIYDCKYVGILLGKGSHYTDIRSALDFNGKYSMILDLNNVSGLNRYDTLTVGGESVSIVDIFGNSVFVSGSKNVDEGNTNFKKDVIVSGKTIQNVITTNSGLNVFLDIVNTNTKAGFSRNIITSQYCGGIYGDMNSINTDFIISYRTGKNENINIQGLEVATNNQGVKFIEGRTGNNLFNYKSQEKLIELDNVQVSGSRQNNILPSNAQDHPLASISDLVNGCYDITVIAEGRADYIYKGVLIKYNTEKSITKIISQNIDLKVDGTDLLKATNGSQNIAPTVAIYFTRIASY